MRVRWGEKQVNPRPAGGRDKVCLNGSCSSKGKRNILQAEVASAASYLMFSIRAPAFGCFDLPR